MTERELSDVEDAVDFCLSLAGPCGHCRVELTPENTKENSLPLPEQVALHEEWCPFRVIAEAALGVGKRREVFYVDPGALRQLGKTLTVPILHTEPGHAGMIPVTLEWTEASDANSD